MKRILVPTDFSPTAEKAFRFALDLAARSNGTIILFHTYIPVESVFVDTEEARQQYNTQTESDIAKRLQRLKKKVAGDASEVAVSAVVGRAPVTDNILGFAENNQIDFIVMGTQGASGLKKTIVGSVAARVIEKADIPVFLVPEKYEMAELHQFVFATDFSNADKASLSLVAEMAGLYNADITVLHFQSIYTGWSELEREKKDYDEYARRLQAELNDCKVHFHVLEVDSVARTMETLDKVYPYDLLAMVRRSRTLLEKFFVGSFTKNMAYVCVKPLLILPGL